MAGELLEPRTGTSCRPRERAILALRFHGGLSQAEIGRRTGVSQMQVSRLISHALGYLRPRLLS